MDSRVLKCLLTCANVINVLSHPSNVHLCTFLSLTFVFPSALALPFPFLISCDGSCGPPTAQVGRGAATCEDDDGPDVRREDDGSVIVSTSMSRPTIQESIVGLKVG